jgi:hypothetical protein
MHRRGSVRIGTAFVRVVIALLVTLGATVFESTTGAASYVSAAAPTEVASVDEQPPVTVNDFFPEDNNLSDCVGLVEKPGCGSESRGGTGQNLVFGFLALGLGIILWRVSVGIRANRADLDAKHR